MPNRRIARAALACLALSAGSAHAESVQAKIDAIEVRLVYETSSMLSENIAPPATFTAWNTVIGEGDAREPANDLMVSVKLSIAADEGNSDVPLQIKVTDAKGKALASRRIASLFFKKRQTVQSLQVQNAGCAGKLKITATYGKQTKATEVAMMCGE